MLNTSLSRSEIQKVAAVSKESSLLGWERPQTQQGRTKEIINLICNDEYMLAMRPYLFTNLVVCVFIEEQKQNDSLLVSKNKMHDVQQLIIATTMKLTSQSFLELIEARHKDLLH